MDKYEIYSDGAFSKSREQGGWAFVALKKDEKIHSDFGGVKNTTNNRMEIMASLEAMLWMKDNNYLSATIFTDSMYVIETMKQNYKKKKNLDLWEKMDNAIKGLTIEWKHIKGHNGNKWNEHCDILAVHGSHLILHADNE